MSLENIQNLMLNLVISHETLHDLYRDPKRYQDTYGLTDEETDFALRMPRRTIGSFQMTIAQKRIRRSQADKYIGRTMSYMSRGQRGNAMRSFISKFVMKKNEWLERVPDYLDHVEKEIFFEDTPADHVNIDIIKFEKWVYEFAQKRAEQKSGNGLVLSPDIAMDKFPFPADLLISTDTTAANFTLLVRNHKTDGYVLAQRTGQGVDLYEIDNCYFQILQECENPISKEQFVAKAKEISKRCGVDKKPDEMLHELLELDILMQIGEER